MTMPRNRGMGYNGVCGEEARAYRFPPEKAYIQRLLVKRASAVFFCAAHKEEAEREYHVRLVLAERGTLL